MTKVIELLEAIKAKNDVKTDYALAKLLDLPTQRISDYLKGTRTPDEYACLQIATALGKTLDEVTAAIRMEAEKDEKRRNAWRNYYKSIGGIAASIMIFVFSFVTLIITTTPPALAQSATYDYASVNNTNYATFRRKFRAAVLAVWHRFRIGFGNACFAG